MMTRTVKFSDLQAAGRWDAKAFVGTKPEGCPKGVYPGERWPHAGRWVRFEATGEFRPPKKGEFYLSGAIIEAYRAPSDLSLEFWIAVPAKPKPIQVCNICRKAWTDGHTCQGK